MADDIVERLRLEGPYHTLKNRQLRAAAADEIESLRASRSSLVEQCARVVLDLGAHIDNHTTDTWDHAYKTAVLGAVDAIRALAVPPSKGTNDEG